MKCTNCNHEIADTAKFCDQCGTRIPIACEGDVELCRKLRGADGQEVPTEKWVSQEWDGTRKFWLQVLAKARELLCGPKDAEIARLKAELAKAMVVIGDHVNELATARTAAANARREALEEVAKDMILRMERPGTPRDHVDVYRMVKNTVLDMRDASRPAAETQTPRLFVGEEVEKFNARFPGKLHPVVGAWIAGHGLRVLLTDTVWALNNLALDIEQHRQPPARDVEGLATALRLCWERDIDWHSYARQVLDYLDGGPRT